MYLKVLLLFIFSLESHEWCDYAILYSSGVPCSMIYDLIAAPDVYI